MKNTYAGIQGYISSPGYSILFLFSHAQALARVVQHRALYY
jgi:hypothetical protein